MPAISNIDALNMTDLMPTDARHQPTNVPENGPNFLDVAAAAQHQYSITDWMPGIVDKMSQHMSWLSEDAANRGPLKFKDLPEPPAPVKGYSVFDDPLKLQGYEDYIKQLSTSESPAELDLRKQQIDTERQHQQLIASDGWRGSAVAFATGMVNPVTLATMMIPLAPEIAGMGRLARVALGTAGVGIGATAQELAQQSVHETGTFKSGLEGVAFQTIVGGLLSGFVAQGLTVAERMALTDKILEEAKNGTPGINPTLEGGSTVGSMAVQDNTAHDMEIAPGGKLISQIMGKWNPMNIVFNSSDTYAKSLAEQVGIVRFMLNKHLLGRGIDSVELVAKRLINQRDLSVQQAVDDAYAAYGQRVGAGAVSRREFGGFAQDAMHNGDVSAVPEAQKLAQKLRIGFNEDKQTLVNLKMLPEDFELLADESYFPKVFDHAAVGTNGLQLRATLRQYFTDHPKVPEPPVKGVPEGASVETVAAHKENLDVVAQQHKEASKAINSALAAQKEADRTVRLHSATSDSVDQKLSELEAKRQYLHEDMSGSTPEQIAREQAKVDREIARVKEQGHAAESKLQAAKTAALEADQAAIAARNAAKETKATLKEAKAAHEQAKKDLAGAQKNAKAAEPKYRDPSEIDAAVEDTIARINSSVRGNADLGHVSNPKPLKGRNLNVPYDVLKPWMVRDLEANMQRYHRAMVPQLTMRTRFGSADLKAELQTVSDNYKNRLANAKTDTEINQLTAEEKRVTQALSDMRDRVLGNVGPKGNNLAMVRAGRLIRAYNYVTLPGSHVLSAMSDYGQLVAKYGLVRTGIMTAKYFTPYINKLSRADAQRFGAALQNRLGEIHGSFADIGQELTSYGKMDRAANWATRQFTKVSGMAAWNTSMQTLTSMLEQDALLRMTQQFKAGTLKAYDLAKFAQHGIQKDDISAIADQLKLYGEDDNGLFRARTELWDNQELARKVEQAIVSNGESVTHNLTAGDMPGFFSNSEVMRLIIQFKSFGIGAVNRIMIPRMQGLAHGDLAAMNGLAMMLTTGAVSSMLKDVSAGREVDARPGHVMAEAMKWSGITGYLPELMDFPMYALPKFDINEADMPAFLQGFHGARIGSSPLETLSGPAYGTAGTALKAIHFLTTLAAQSAGVPVKEAQASGLHDVRKLVPGNNIFFFNRLVNAMESSVANSMNLSGATGKSFYDTLTESRPPKE